ncbi:MAG: hypothetical protein AAGH99_08850 [Planctomycetota bacterium]
MTQTKRPFSAAFVVVTALTVTGCSALYDAGFRSNEARYREAANPDVSGLPPELAEAKLAAAENSARRLEFIERQRRLRQLGGTGTGAGG